MKIKIRKIKKNEAGVSEILGTIFAIAITAMCCSAILITAEIVNDKLIANARNLDLSNDNSNHKPQLINFYPENRAIDIMQKPILHVTVLDLENGTPLLVTFYRYVYFGADAMHNNYIQETFNARSGETVYCMYKEAVTCGATYYWSVTATDGTSITYSDIYSFTLKDLCIP